MAKPAGRKLKVFVAQIGFYDTVVAAPSQAAALRAWGTHQNLFTGGQARIIDDPQAIEAATSSPEVPLRRLVGTTNPFELKPRGLPAVPDAPKNWAEDVHDKRPAPRPAKTPKLPSRKALNQAEAALRKIDDARKYEETDLRRRQNELDAEREALQTRYVDQRKQATGRLVEARTAYRRAGGTD